MSDNQKCRICERRANDIDGALIWPCKCIFEDNAVHKKCLVRWREGMLVTNPNAKHFYCDHCKADFPADVFAADNNDVAPDAQQIQTDRLLSFYRTCSYFFVVTMWDKGVFSELSFLNVILLVFILLTPGDRIPSNIKPFCGTFIVVAAFILNMIYIVEFYLHIGGQHDIREESFGRFEKGARLVSYIFACTGFALFCVQMLLKGEIS